jgi:hypothetical protein
VEKLDIPGQGPCDSLFPQVVVNTDVLCFIVRWIGFPVIDYSSVIFKQKKSYVIVVRGWVGEECCRRVE